MNRKFLEELGLEKETINAIMARHGSAVNELQDSVQSLEKEKEQLEERIKQHEAQLDELESNSGDNELKKQIEELKAANEQLKEEKATELAEMQHQHKISLVVKDLGAKDEEFIAAKLNDLELKDGELVGLDDRVTELKEKHPLLFDDVQPEQPKQPKKWSQGGLNTVSNSGLTKAEIMQEKDANKRQRLIQENKELFQ
jgi:septal ring factor EnvC (AmiA/AmiB activator)